MKKPIFVSCTGLPFFIILSNISKPVLGFELSQLKNSLNYPRNSLQSPENKRNRAKDLIVRRNMDENVWDGILRGIGLGKGSSGAEAWNDSGPTLDELEKILFEQQTTEEREFFELVTAGRGPTNSRANLRLFDAEDGTVPRVTLYRDSAAWCPYCQKVWLQLEEKRIPYAVKKVPLRCYGDKPMWFKMMNPSGMLPVAEIDGRLVSESNDIMQLIEETFPECNPLLPKATDPESQLVGPLLRLERELFSVWFRWLTSRANHASQKRQFEAVMDRVNAALGQTVGPFFLGSSLSLVDLMFTPFLERMSASLPYYKGLLIRKNSRWPAVEEWFQAMDARATYQGTKSDFYTHCYDLPPQIGGCVSAPDEKLYADEIDAFKNVLWTNPPDDGIEPVGTGTEEEFRREAASRLLHNFEGVLRFSLRAVGSPGFPSVSAELADPNATPNETFAPQVSFALRKVIFFLLGQQRSLTEAQSTENSALCQETIQCLVYLRDRVGVPRDMSFGAARQLRAHINLIIGSL